MIAFVYFDFTLHCVDVKLKFFPNRLAQYFTSLVNFRKAIFGYNSPSIEQSFNFDEWLMICGRVRV